GIQLADYAEFIAGAAVDQQHLAGDFVFDQYDLSWQGPRVLASCNGAHAPQLSGDSWQVNLNDLNAIQQAVHHAQGGQVAQPQERFELRDLR
ncbi:hypothetical protein Q6319_27180, partial [Klebsiella pneumoniae]|nr:hypothetical protein [Klebsiella pneumoniae]